MSFTPKDLLKDTSQPDTDKNYFNVTITDLEPDTTYPIQFAWVFSDKTVGDYSAVYPLVTDLETAPKAPEFRSEDAEGGQNLIRLTWSGRAFDGTSYGDNLDRIDVYISSSNSTFGDGSKPAAFFRTAGNFILAAPAGTYTITLRAMTTRGRISPASEARTVTVTGQAAVEAPTLATGLSATTAPFGLTVNWNGTYAGDSFEGFKAVRIFASTLDLGSSTTTGITNSNSVGNLTIDLAVNRLNIGLDNLRVALGLSTNAEVYNDNAQGVPQPWIYLYYVTTNILNEDYSVDGVITYTRINSTPLVPTKANFIDLQRGIISIENLVAGNGQFTSWLRTGTAGGARIELSGTAAFTPSGESIQVLPGLSVYSTGSTPILRADLAGNVSFGGYTPADIEDIEGLATTAADKADTAEAKALEALSGLDAKLAIGGSVISDPLTRQITAINANGVTVYSSATNSPTGAPTPGGSNAFIVMNANGIAAYPANSSVPTFIISASTGSATFRGTVEASTITGSTFTSTNYGTPGGTGIAIATSGNGGSILFNSAGTQKGNITVISTGMQIVGGSSNILLTDSTLLLDSPGINLQIDNSARLTSTGGDTSGGNGILRNTWASTGSPTGGTDGDVWLRYA